MKHVIKDNALFDRAIAEMHRQQLKVAAAVASHVPEIHMSDDETNDLKEINTIRKEMGLNKPLTKEWIAKNRNKSIPSFSLLNDVRAELVRFYGGDVR